MVISTHAVIISISDVYSVSFGMGDCISMSISGDSLLDETLN